MTRHAVFSQHLGPVIETGHMRIYMYYLPDSISVNMLTPVVKTSYLLRQMVIT